MPNDDRVELNISPEPQQTAVERRIALSNRSRRVYLRRGGIQLSRRRAHMHFVHRPDIVEEVRGAKPRVRVRDVMIGACDVFAARMAPDHVAGDAAEQCLH